MYIKKIEGPTHVRLPNGKTLTRSDLPPKTTSRWVASRKARVVLAVKTNLISKEEACSSYGLSQEEFDGWCYAINSHGINALKATKVQNYRQP